MSDEPDPIFIVGPDGALVGAMSAEQLHADAERLFLEILAAEGDNAKLTSIATAWQSELAPEHLQLVALETATMLAVLTEKLRRAILRIDPRFDLLAQMRSRLARVKKRRGGGR